MTERERKYSDAIDLLTDIMDAAPTSAIMLRFSKVIGEVYDMMRDEQNLPAEVEEPIQ